MKKINRYIFIFTLSVLSAVYPFKSVSAQVGVYLGGWGGYTISSYTGGDNGHDYYDDYDLDIKETSAWGVKVGYANPFFNYLALEAEYSYLNPDIKDSAYIDGDVKISNLMFNVIGKYPLGIIQPYFGVGLGFSYSDMSRKDIRIVSTKMSMSFCVQSRILKFSIVNLLLLPTPKLTGRRAYTPLP